MIDINNLHARLEISVSENRYKHCVEVAERAKELAEQYHNNIEKAYVAGLLHDCAKQFDSETMLKLAYEAGIDVTETEESQPVALLHAQVGAYIAGRDYCINDKDILQAISFHQSGGVGMTALDKIVALADGTIQSRSDLYLGNIRKILKSDLDAAYLEIYVYSVTNLMKNRLLLDNKKSLVYNHLILEMRDKKSGIASGININKPLSE